MLAVALACLPVFMTGREIARWEGGVFLGYYGAYVAYLILAAQQHDALPGLLGRDAGLRRAADRGDAGGGAFVLPTSAVGPLFSHIGA
jgi:hypothetical protein